MLTITELQKLEEFVRFNGLEKAYILFVKAVFSNPTEKRLKALDILADRKKIMEEENQNKLKGIKRSMRRKKSIRQSGLSFGVF